METFKFLTFNCFKLGGPADPDHVIDSILALEPDVVGFQEVFNTPNTVGFRSRNVRKILRRRLEGGTETPGAGFRTVWQPASGPGPFRFLFANRFRDGILLAARAAAWDFSLDEDYFSRKLNDRTFTRRVIQGLVLRPKGSDLRVAVFNTHLTFGNDPPDRQRRAREIGEAVDFIAAIEEQRQPAASILTGDFNAVSNELRRELPEPFEDTWLLANHGVDEREGITFDRDHNTIIQAKPSKPEDESRRIDYVFLKSRQPALKVVRSQVVLNERDPATDQNLSDHYGVLTELALTT